jgi:hypothetical protein
MNEDLPQPFGRLTPRPAPNELRARVLGAVANELARRKTPRWERVFECAVAASLALGIGLNVWLERADEAWQARVYGPLPVSRAIADVAQAVASVTDAQTGQWIQQRLSESRPARPPADPLRSERYERLFHGLTDFRTDVTL